MLASRMGGFLRQRPQLMERMRNLRGMRGMGRNMMMPGMGIGSLARMPSRDVNDLPVPSLVSVGLPKGGEPVRKSDIMPRDGMMPKQPPQIGLAPQMPGVPPRGSGLPPMPNPMMDMQGRRFMKDGGEVDPNPGITALRKVAPEAVKAMGYAGGGSADAAKALTRASFATAPISSTLGMARGAVLSPIGGIVSLGLAGKSLADYYNTLENPPMVTTTYTQEEMDALRRPARVAGVAKGSPLVELGGGRTISEQDRQIVSDYFGIEGRDLSDRDISILMKNIQDQLAEKNTEEILDESGRTISNLDLLSALSLGTPGIIGMGAAKIGKSLSDLDKDVIPSRTSRD